MLGKAARTAVGTKRGRKASKKVLKTAVGTRTGRKAIKAGAKTAARAGKGAGKGAGKAGLKAGKARASSSIPGESGGARYIKYGLFAIIGFTAGALLARSREDGASSSYTGTTGHHAPDAGSPAGQRGQTWGTGSPLGAAGGAGSAAEAPPQGPERARSESQPLIGEEPRPQADIATEKQQEVEQRVRTRIGEDPRTQDMPRVNVEVNDGVAELRGVAPSEDVKRAVGEIAEQTEGVREVRNLLSVG